MRPRVIWVILHKKNASCNEDHLIYIYFKKSTSPTYVWLLVSESGLYRTFGMKNHRRKGDVLWLSRSFPLALAMVAVLEVCATRCCNPNAVNRMLYTGCNTPDAVGCFRVFEEAFHFRTHNSSETNIYGWWIMLILTLYNENQQKIFPLNQSSLSILQLASEEVWVIFLDAIVEV